MAFIEICESVAIISFGILFAIGVLYFFKELIVLNIFLMCFTAVIFGTFSLFKRIFLKALCHLSK